MKTVHSDFKITPETKVGTLLDQFPQLEDVLLKMAPAFKKLRNPVLRKTVAKIATLRQVSDLGKLPLSEMINALRAEAGLEGTFKDQAEEERGSGPPSWYSDSKVIAKVDIRPLLDAGEQPLRKVFREAQKLKTGEIVEVLSPFLPAPLIDQAKKTDYLVWSREERSGVVRTYLMRTKS